MSSLLISSQWPWVPHSTDACHRVGDCPWAQRHLIFVTATVEALLYGSNLWERHICYRLWVWGTSCCLALLLVFGFCICTKHSSQPSTPRSSVSVTPYPVLFALLEKVVGFQLLYQNLTAVAQGHFVAHSSPEHPVRHMTDYIISPLSPLCPRSVDHPLPGSSLSTDFGSWQMVSGCGSIQERPVLHTDSSLPFSFQDELPNSCL